MGEMRPNAKETVRLALQPLSRAANFDEHPAEPRVCLAGGLKKRKCSRRLEEARLRNQQWSFISALLTYWTKYPTRSV